MAVARNFMKKNAILYCKIRDCVLYYNCYIIREISYDTGYRAGIQYIGGIES
jgi:hypothetical protein